MTTSFRIQRWLYYRLWFPVVSLWCNLVEYSYAPRKFFSAKRLLRLAENVAVAEFAAAQANTIFGAPVRWALVSVTGGLSYREDNGDWQAWPRTTILKGYGDCEDFAALNAHLLKRLGYKPVLWRLFRSSGSAHTVVTTQDWHWLVSEKKTIDLKAHMEQTGESDPKKALLSALSVRYEEVWK